MRGGGGDRVHAFLGGAAAAQIGIWDSAQQLEGFLELSGASRDHVLCAHWDEETFKPAFVVFVVPGVQWLVVSVRGSMNWKAVLTDIAAEPSEVPGGLAHSGMVRSARWVLSQIRSVLEAALVERPDYSVVCTGHSLGANVAALLALFLREEPEGTSDREEEQAPAAAEAFRKTVAYTFGGSPLMSPELGVRCAPFVLSVSRNFDFVTRLSVLGVDRLMLELTDEERSEDGETVAPRQTRADGGAAG